MAHVPKRHTMLAPGRHRMQHSAPVQIELPSVKQGEAESRDVQSFQWLLADARGRRIARQMLRYCQVDVRLDAAAGETLAFGAGLRNGGQYLRERMRYLDPEGYLRFEAEFLEEEKLLQQALKLEAESALKKEPHP